MTIVFSKPVEFDKNGSPIKFWVQGYVDTASEEKPTNKIASGSRCTETETGLVSVFSENSNQWIPWMTLKE